MKIRPLATLALALTLPFAAVACGGGEDDNNSGERPTVEEIVTGLKTDPNAGALSDDVLTCVATELVASDLPNGVLRATAEGRDAEVDEGNVDEYEAAFTQAGAACAQEAMSDISVPETGS